jgi:hypothetical protein
MAAIGCLVLLPFANSTAYASEILTPVTHRATDVRGENAEQSTLSGRPGIRFLQLMPRLESNDFLIMAIAVVVFYSTRQDPMMRLCFLFLLMSLPYGLIFGYGLNYRSLQFVLLFSLLIGRLIPRQYAIAFLSFLLLVDAVYCADPMTVNEIHVPITHDKFSLIILSW